MIASFVSIIVLLAFLASAYGWGRLLFKPIYGDGETGWAYDTVLGLAVWVFIGGILNVAHFAYPIALDCIFGLGVFATLEVQHNEVIVGIRP